MASELSEDIEDYDLYHVDFTTASEWEVFIARVEEIILEWKLNTRKVPPKSMNFAAAEWSTFTENISFAEVYFSLTRHFIRPSEVDSEEVNDGNDGDSKDDLPKTPSNSIWLDEVMNPSHDFLPLDISGDETHPHVLAKWYGLTDFVVLTPIKTGITSESKLKVLLSSLCIAVNNTGCKVPMFVRSLEFWRKFYMGVCEGNGIRSEFEMVHLREVPPQCRYLTGLLSVFKSKIGQGLLVEPVRVAAKFCYILDQWGIQFTWAQERPVLDLSVNELTTIPFGCYSESISSLSLYTRWEETLETLVVDSETFSDFDPLTAPHWSLSICKEENLKSLLALSISQFIMLCVSNRTVEELLGDFALREPSGDMIQPLSVLTESRIPTLTSMLSGYVARKHSTNGPIQNRLLMPIIYYLFPDGNTVQKYSYDMNEINAEKTGSSQRMKTCSVDSLVWRLAIVMDQVLLMLGGEGAATHLWHEFSQELRFRWTNSTLIPGVGSGFPDPKTCLLHQKLQMINCCIERRLKGIEEASTNRESVEVIRKAPLFIPNENDVASECSEDSDESEDEFFDCDEETTESGSVDVIGGGDARTKAVRTSRVAAPVGRLAQHATLKLLKTGLPLFIPITQGATPKTEDQLEEDAEVLIQLGADAEGSQLRAKLMSASLLSDMESFKAANPGAVIEDFIRWYSPRDWIEEDELDEFGQKKGKLSARMLLPGNTWLEVWSSARGIPARKQKRLFDETTEGEKALHFIESQDPAGAAKLLLPVLIHAGLKRLSDECESLTLPVLQTGLSHMTKKLETLARQPIIDMRRYQELCEEMCSAEVLYIQIRSLEHKFSLSQDLPTEVIREFAYRLLTESVVPVPGGWAGPLAVTIKNLFVATAKVNEFLKASSEKIPSAAGGSVRESTSGGRDSPTVVLPPPVQKEFILRAISPRPNKHSTPCPHRLSAVIKNDITMAAMFSQDNTFF
ncbi:RAB3 GTPase activating protein subunit 1 isoform X3 [Rhodnius prolixus]|uniref:RAB3 GTPase activating protein subunit 1 isoform X3 n=1 Tax=Rhodnius prolixus TaxID=13249 RepID=UPI003D18C4C7